MLIKMKLKSLNISRKSLPEGVITKVPSIIKEMIIKKEPDKWELFQQLWKDMMEGKREKITLDDLNVQ